MEFFSVFFDTIQGFITESGFVKFFQEGGYKYAIMIVIALVLMYLAIKKGFEPLLLLPIAFGILLVNLPGSGIMAPPSGEMAGGLLYYLSKGEELGIYPPLIFLGIGALTDFSPLIANPKSLLLGAAAQVGIYIAFILALLLGFSAQEAGAISIIGGADGPTAIYSANILAPHLLGTIAVAAYSYMALIPIIQPPIMRLLTTKKERAIKMDQLREVSQKEKIIFPIMVTVIVALIVPPATPLVGMLMLGNLFKVSKVTEKLAATAADALLYIVTILIGLCVGASTQADIFLSVATLKIMLLGLIAFAFSTAGGIIFGKIMCVITRGKVNPLIGAAGVSAVPMSARIAQKVGQEENKDNYLLMHAMGPNVAGVIGSAVAAGVLIYLLK